jgi:hypothetical protein
MSFFMSLSCLFARPGLGRGRRNLAGFRPGVSAAHHSAGVVWNNYKYRVFAGYFWLKKAFFERRIENRKSDRRGSTILI